jgi:hypothetical protein
LLFPVATVILGGLVTSTLAELLIRPGLFWHCGGAGITETETALPSPPPDRQTSTAGTAWNQGTSQ